MHLVQIVPRLAPFDGVGDYALRLAEGLRARHGVTSSFIEAGARPSGGASQAEFEVRQCEPGSAAALAHALGKPSYVLLHYVGYGYAQRGAPLWLARAIEGTRSALGFRLSVVFHELFATGRPWQSSFWLGPLQKHVVRRVAGACDGALLTREASGRWLEATGELAGKPMTVLPISSSVGEPEAVAAIGARRNALVVWGGSGMKRVVYGERWPLVLEACTALGITHIDDVGAPAESYPRASAVRVEPHGFLPDAEVGRMLGGAQFGLVVYPRAFLAKSTLFAAYAAHGVVPLVLDDSQSVAMDGLEAGRHFLALAPSALAAARPKFDDVARAARAWYGSHSTTQHADGVWRMLQEGSQ
jgi:hypothetical protein